MGSLLRRIPREIAFAANPSTLSAYILVPEGIFRHFYSGLAPVIEANNRKRKHHPDGFIDLNTDQREPLINQQVCAWRESFSEDPEIVATITCDDNSKTQYKVEKRTNFSPDGLRKPPSVVYLMSEFGHTAIMREARAYAMGGFMSRYGAHALGSRFDCNASAQFSDGSGKVEPPPRRSAMYVPEPQLLNALEALYDNRDYPRVTPEIAVIGTSKDKAWYVRDFLPVVVDVELHPDALAHHVATWHALGIMELLDRQLIHYCRSGKNIVNYDPDFMLFATKPELVQGRDISDLIKTIREEGPKLGVHFGEDDFHTLRTEAEKHHKLLIEDHKLEPTTLLDYMSREVSADACKRVELVP